MTNTVRFVNSIHDIGQELWTTLSRTDNPFLRYDFLAALEDSHSIGSVNTGWLPHYALLEKQGQLLAIAPVFQKMHSYGEYVFDWGWADAYQRHGLKYYPKLVWAIPFTPSTGPRIISQAQPEQQAHYVQLIAQALTNYCQHQKFSGWHCLFPEPSTNEAISQTPASLPIMSRTSCQFHWFNESFIDFDHYLEKFTSRKRKNIKKERSRLQTLGFQFSTKTADQITPSDIETFYHCYQLTYAKRNMRGYLSLEFFQLILQSMPEQLVLVQAQQVSTSLACALYFKDDDNLYGRYWGCLEEFDSLHFECCYYQGIEYCIEHDISHFDPGTQGEHKISRGFEPTLCYSQHWIAHPQFSQAINEFLLEEESDIKNYITQATSSLPFNATHSSQKNA